MRVVVVASPVTPNAGVWNYWQRYREALSGLGHDVVVLVPDAGGSVPPLTLDRASLSWARRGVSAVIEEYAPDVLVTSISQSDVLVGAAPRRVRSSVPWLVSVHGVPFPVPGQTLSGRARAWRAAWTRAARRADAVVAVSEGTRSFVAAVLDRDVGLARSLVPDRLASELERAASTRAPAASLRVGFVGRLAYEKDPLLFARVCERVGLVGTVFGAGPLQPDLRARPAVTLAGTAQPAELYARLDVLLVTSRSEGLPLVLLEAAFAGVVPLAVDLGGVAEAVHPDARDRLLVPAGQREDLDAWAARLSLLDSVSTRAELVRLQREWVEPRFSAAAVAPAFVDLLGGLRR